MPSRQKKLVRCPFMNKNIHVILEIEKDAEGREVLLGMSCKERDLLERKGKDCEVQCKNYFYSD